MGDLLVVPVVDGALAEPAREDGLDREVELLVRVARKVAAGVVAVNRAQEYGYTLLTAL